MRDERPHASTNQPATIPALASEALMEKGVNDFCRAARVAGETMESAMREPETPAATSVASNTLAHAAKPFCTTTHTAITQIARATIQTTGCSKGLADIELISQAVEANPLPVAGACLTAVPVPVALQLHSAVLQPPPLLLLLW